MLNEIALEVATNYVLCCIVLARQNLVTPGRWILKKVRIFHLDIISPPFNTQKKNIFQ